MNTKKVSYKGKKVYIGIDVHKKTYTFSASCEGVITKTVTTPAEIDKFTQNLKKWFLGAQIYSVYEAGFSGFALHRKLESSKIKNIVINPASLEVASKDKVKTDKKDSKKLAVQLATGRLKGIWIPSKEEELDRLITRTREQFIRDRSRTAHKIKSRLFYFNLISRDDDRMVSDKLLREYESMHLPEELKFSLVMLIGEWRFLNDRIKEINLEMKAQSLKDNYKEEIYRSIPGIGEVSARILSNELGDLSKKFKNERALFQFTGLTPCEYSSGEKKRLGNIDRQGSSRVRNILVECSWRAISLDSSLMKTFNDISYRRGKKRAIVAIARKLIGRMRACFIKQELYCIT